MRIFKQASLLLLVLSLGAAACFVPNVALVDPAAEATSMAQTVIAMVAGTQSASSPTALPPSGTPTSTLTPQPPTSTVIRIQTQPPTPTPTLLLFFTVAPLVPQISVSVPTNCRAGPGKAYEMVGALLVGETAQIYARDPTGMYWYIPNPDAEGDFCWVWGEYATLAGSTESLPMYTPAPTPTASSTSTPAPGFEASYEGLIDCAPEWWTEFTLQNTGLIVFRSVGLIVKDTVTSESVSDVSDSFTDLPDCSSSTSKPALQPSRGIVVSAPAFSYDPTGHKLRATITLCSKTGQNGVCVTDTINFKP